MRRPSWSPSGRRTSSGSARPRHGDLGLAEVLGSMLLIAVTVIAAAGLMTTLSRFQRVDGEKYFAELELSLDPGSGGSWGTGDEIVALAHIGGDALPRGSARVSVLIGSTTTTFEDTGLLGDFADGTLAIGETWSGDFTVAQGQTVAVDVFRSGSTSQLIFSGTTAPEGT